jgi:pimeloyl-ACP methyl ester carboxylesterase
MKIRRIFLFRLSAFLLSLILIINPFGLGRLTVGKVNAQSAPRPYVVFVNGQENCCAWGMTALQDRLANELNAEIRYVPYSNFRDGGQSGGGNQFDWSSVDTQFLEDGADFINNQLDRNRPLILIGHSFGADSILSLIPRINRRIQLVAVIDPVAAGGLRQTIVQNRSIPSTVDYFFNRWQENYPWPVDFERSGQIFSCEASSQGRRNCDEDSQNIARNADFSPITRECRWDEAITCPGSSLFPPRTGRVQVRVSHQDLPRDAYLQQTLGERISEVLASYTPPDELNAGVIYAVTSDYRLLWYKHYGSQDGSVSWSSSREIGQGWNYRQVFPGGEGVIYAVTHDNKLLWYKHDGWQDGSVSWSGPYEIVSRGWNYRDTFSGGNGIIYGVTPDNKLFWYRHNGWQDGSISWSSPREIVSRGWNYRETFSSGDGIIYGVTPDNKLFWYRHNGWQDGSISWSSPREVVSRAWDYRDTFSGGDGIIYGVTSDNKLFWYKHNGWQDGSISWSSPREVVSRAWDFLQSF